MSIISVLNLKVFATSFACSISSLLYVSFSGIMSPKTLFPPSASAEMAAAVELSTPPEIPITTPFAPTFST